MRMALVGCSAAMLAFGAARAQDHGGLGGGGALSWSASGAPDGCVTAEERARAEDDLRAFRGSEEGRRWLSRGISGALPFRFYPQAGTLYRDLHHNNYVDLDLTSGVLDFACGDHTYDGHRGHDSGVRTFDEQDIGVPVFAVADGVVVSWHDGEPDRNTEWRNQPANYVIIEHGGGLTTRYWHLKNGSVRPVSGQQVEAGEQIGLTASSGNSTGPHLHFEARLNGSTFETMAGPCQGGASSWEEQWGVERGFVVRDFGFARGDIGDFYEGPPHGFPRSNHVDFDDMIVSYWMQGLNIPADTVYRYRFIAPDGRLDFDSGERPVGFTAGQSFRKFWAFWTWNISDMRREAGAWMVQVEINGVQELEFEVRVFENERLPHTVNRPPHPVTATIAPENPDDDDVLWARIAPDLVHDDPDFDVVRYTYTWRVNGEIAREVRSAAHADALPASFHSPGDTVTCEVRAQDGVCPGDVTGDGVVDNVDLAVMVNAWGGSDIDVTGDEIVGSGDIAVLLAGWGACP